MSDAVHHQADPPGITWDITVDGHRYLVIEEADVSDCGYTGSRNYAYLKLGCRCDICRSTHTDYMRALRQRRRSEEPA